MFTMREPRSHRIRSQLDRHFMSEVGVAVATPEPAMWPVTLSPLAVLGWSWPVHNPNSDVDPTLNKIIVPYCPEIIDTQTDMLDDFELETYLTVIKFVCDLHIAHWDEPNVVERFGKADKELRRSAPEFGELLDRMLSLAALVGQLEIRETRDDSN